MNKNELNMEERIVALERDVKSLKILLSDKMSKEYHGTTDEPKEKEISNNVETTIVKISYWNKYEFFIGNPIFKDQIKIIKILGDGTFNLISYKGTLNRWIDGYWIGDNYYDEYVFRKFERLEIRVREPQEIFLKEHDMKWNFTRAKIHEQNDCSLIEYSDSETENEYI